MADTPQIESHPPHRPHHQALKARFALMKSGSDTLKQKAAIREAHRTEIRTLTARSDALDVEIEAMVAGIRKAESEGKKISQANLANCQKLNDEQERVYARIEELENPRVPGEGSDESDSDVVFALNFPLVEWRSSPEAYESWEGKVKRARDKKLRDLGFAHSCCLPPKTQLKWKSPAYPEVLTQEAVQQWEECMENFADAHKSAPTWSVFERTYSEELAHDMKLLEELDPHLVPGVKQPQVDADLPRPDRPTKEYCLVTPRSIRWDGTVEVQPRHFRLLELVLSRLRNGKAAIPFENLEMGDKSIMNRVSELNKLLLEVQFPITLRTDSSHVIAE